MTDVSETLRQYFERAHPAGAVAAYVFGSHARGRSHAESDVDVAVVFAYGQAPDPAGRRAVAARLHADLIAATHVNHVDLVVLNDAPAELAAAIVCDGRRVYVADHDAAHAFERTALLRAADLRPFLARTRRRKLEALRR